MEQKPAASSVDPRLTPSPKARVPMPLKSPPASRLWELLFGWGFREQVKLNNLWMIDCKKASTEETQNLYALEGSRHINQLFSIPSLQERIIGGQTAGRTSQSPEGVALTPCLMVSFVRCCPCLGQQFESERGVWQCNALENPPRTGVGGGGRGGPGAAAMG